MSWLCSYACLIYRPARVFPGPSPRLAVDYRKGKTRWGQGGRRSGCEGGTFETAQVCLGLIVGESSDFEKESSVEPEDHRELVWEGGGRKGTEQGG